MAKLEPEFLFLAKEFFHSIRLLTLKRDEARIFKKKERKKERRDNATEGMNLGKTLDLFTEDRNNSDKIRVCPNDSQIAK